MKSKLPKFSLEDFQNIDWRQCEYEEEHISKKEQEEKIKAIIKKELNIWKRAYPKQAELLQKFADKIKIELMIQL